MGYATRNNRPPRTLTDAETARLLKVSGEHVDGFRDHMILSFALGTGLRESEIVALNVEDVTADGKTPRRTIQLRVFKRSGRASADPKNQRVPVPDSLYYKLEKYLTLVHHANGPLFLSRKHHERLSGRAVRWMFQRWQKAARFDHPYPFHSLRHTAITNIYRVRRDVRLAQRYARHAKLQTTQIYTHVSDQELLSAAKDLPS